MTGILLRRERCENTEEIERRGPCENGGRDWSNVSTSQRMQRTASNYQKLGENKEQREHGPADSLILDFWSPKL